MQFLLLLLLLICLCNAQHSCKRFTSCSECIISSCIWYKKADHEWCDYTKIHRSIYKSKVRSERFCGLYTRASSTPSSNIDETTGESSTIENNGESSTIENNGESNTIENIEERSTNENTERMISSTTEPNTTMAHDPIYLPVVKPPFDLEQSSNDDAFEKKTEKEILAKIRKQECQLFASVRRLRRLRIGKPLTRSQYKHAVKQCLKNSV